MKKKMNGLNKLLAMLLVLIMVFGTMTVLADGEEAPAADPPAAGEGNNLPTQETPVIVQKDEDQTYDCNIAVESSGSEVIAVEDTNGGNIEIEGDVSATATGKGGDAIAVYEELEKKDSNSEITVDGNVTAAATGENDKKDDADAKAIDITVKNGKEATVIVEGNVTATSDNGTATGIEVNVNSNQESATVVVGGNVEATGGENDYGIRLEKNAANFTSATVIVEGDVTATNGVGLQVDKNGGGDVLVEGTLYGEQAAVNVEKNKSETNLTVWELATGEDGKLADGKKPDDFLKTVNYIVKLAENLQKEDTVVTTENHNTVAVVDNQIIHGDETKSDDYEYHTANANEDVTVTFTVDDEDLLEGIYYNAERKDNLLTTYEKIGANTFKLIAKMLPGGAMLLGLSYKQAEVEEPVIEEPKDEEPKDEEPKDEEPKDEEPKDEEPKDEEPKDEGPKAEGPRDEEPRDNQPKADEPGNNEPKDNAGAQQQGQQAVIANQADALPGAPAAAADAQEEAAPVFIAQAQDFGFFDDYDTPLAGALIILQDKEKESLIAFFVDKTYVFMTMDGETAESGTIRLENGEIILVNSKNEEMKFSRLDPEIVFEGKTYNQQMFYKCGVDGVEQEEGKWEYLLHTDDVTALIEAMLNPVEPEETEEDMQP